MAIRSAKEAKMHEIIIKSLASVYESRGASKILTNLEGNNNAVVDGITVDLIVKNPFPMHFKIETETSVKEGEAIAWKSISEKIGTFFLMVPEPLKQEALRIINKNNIKNIRLCYYKIVDNKLKFINLP
ncbi:MAG: hypothetical protein N2114_04210 [Candidatus Goldbacteria bacterium]|nr:hypothetical protein [Candidatus Goldiibacteriota bacterium]